MFNQLNNWSSDLEASGVPCVFLGKDTLFPDEMLWLGTRCFETDSFSVVICFHWRGWRVFGNARLMRDSVRAARGPPVTHFHTVWGRQGPLSKHCGFLECFPSSVLWLSEKVLVNLPPGFIPHSVPSICFSSPPRSLSAAFWLPFRSDFSSQISSVLMSHSWSFWGTWRTDRAADGEAARDPTLDPLRALCLSRDKDESLRRRGLGVRFDMDFLRRRGRQRELIWDQGLSPLPSWVTCQCEAQPPGCYRYSDRPKYLFTRLEKQNRLNIWAESGEKQPRELLINSA